MFVGHYAAGLALKSVENKASLGLLFLAVQFVDILFFPFVLAGIERIRIIENFTDSTHFELTYMPYTHSLVASFLIAGLVYAAFRILSPKRKSVALVIGIAVLSHWFFDLIVHIPDLPILTDNSMKLGFGLWNSAVGTFILEAALLFTGLWMYLRSTTSRSMVGKYGMFIFVIVLLLINVVNIFGPPFGDDKFTLALSALVMYFLFAGVAQWLDGKRFGISG